jgi:hypothetical protein
VAGAEVHGLSIARPLRLYWTCDFENLKEKNMKIVKSLRPPKSNEEREAKLDQELNSVTEPSSTRGLPTSAHLATKDRPSPQMVQKQVVFMPPEIPTENLKSPGICSANSKNSIP